MARGNRENFEVGLIYLGMSKYIKNSTVTSKFGPKWKNSQKDEDGRVKRTKYFNKGQDRAYRNRYAPELFSPHGKAAVPQSDFWAFGYVVSKVFMFAGFSEQKDYLLTKKPSKTNYHARIAKALCARLRRSN